MNNDKKPKLGKNKGSKDPGSQGPRFINYFYIIAILAVLLFNGILWPMLTDPVVEEATYSEFLQQVDAGLVKEVDIQPNQIVYKTGEGDDAQYYQTGLVDDPNLVQRLEENQVEFTAEIVNQPSIWLTLLLSYGLPILIFFFIGRRLMGMMSSRGGAGGLALGGQAGKVYVPDGDKKNFLDVAGQDEAKESLTEIVDYLAHPGRYAQIGARCPKGILLVGPPGTGKTLLAKAVAGEAHVPFFSISGSEFVEMFVGRGAAKVRELFDQANKKAPCIVFIDEIDTIGKRRDGAVMGNDEREQTLNQLLTEMDGFEANNGVVILAATNRPDTLDPALLRPGRFDRQVRVELPDLNGRIAIYKVHAKNYKMDTGIDYDLLARATAGASGADIANIVNEGALRAVRMNRQVVTQEDLEESIEVVIAGQQRKNAILSDEEKRIIAYHEIGHALVAAKQSGSAPVHKITIVPRTSGALGYTMQVEEKEKSLLSKSDALRKLSTYAGGRAAEALVFGDITSGASNDIQQMTKIARAMVTQYGMTDEFGMMGVEEQTNVYLGGGTRSNAAPNTLEKVDTQVKGIIQEAYDTAYRILQDNRDALDELTEYLLKEETITGKEFMDILEKDKVHAEDDVEGI